MFLPEPHPQIPSQQGQWEGSRSPKIPRETRKDPAGKAQKPPNIPQKSPRRPEGKAISSPIWNPPNRTPRTRIGRLKTPGFQSLLFAPYHFLFIFTFFLDWNPYQNPRTPRTPKFPQNSPKDPEVNWFGSCPATISPLRTPDTPSEPGPPKKFLAHFFFFLPYTVVFPVTTLGPKTLRGPRILSQAQFTNPPQTPNDPILRICLDVLGTFFNSSILQFFTNYELKISPRQKNPEMNPPKQN